MSSSSHWPWHNALLVMFGMLADGLVVAELILFAMVTCEPCITIVGWFSTFWVVTSEGFMVASVGRLIIGSTFDKRMAEPASTGFREYGPVTLTSEFANSWSFVMQVDFNLVVLPGMGCCTTKW